MLQWRCLLEVVTHGRSTEYLFLSLGTIAEGAPVVPISAQLKYNIEVICEFICKKIPVPVRDFTSSARLIGRYFYWVFQDNLKQAVRVESV